MTWSGIAESLAGKRSGPREITKVSQLYHYVSVSQYMFDLASRTFLNLGNWFSSVGAGLVAGALAFYSARQDFKRSAKLRPPAFISQAKATRDLDRALASGTVRWRSSFSDEQEETEG